MKIVPPPTEFLTQSQTDLSVLKPSYMVQFGPLFSCSTTGGGYLPLTSHMHTYISSYLALIINTWGKKSKKKKFPLLSSLNVLKLPKLEDHSLHTHTHTHVLYELVMSLMSLAVKCNKNVSSAEF